MNRHVYFRQQEKNALMHHGIKGQKWGVRRYQNADGSLTTEGRERYGSNKTQTIKRELTSKERMAINTKLRKLQNKFEDEYLLPLWNGEQKEHPSPNYVSCKNEYKNSKEMQDLKTKKYGSDEWFEARDKVYTKQKELDNKYKDKILSDFGIKDSDPVIRDEFYNGIKGYLTDWSYANVESDYNSIADPVTGDRDYGLTDYPAYERWAKRQGVN